MPQVDCHPASWATASAPARTHGGDGTYSRELGANGRFVRALICLNFFEPLLFELSSLCLRLRSSSQQNVAATSPTELLSPMTPPHEGDKVKLQNFGTGSATPAVAGGVKDEVTPSTVPGEDKDPAAPATGAGQVPALAVNSSNYRKEYQVLKRIAEGPRALQFPNIAKAFGGTKEEQREVLKSFLVSGGNLDHVEASVEASRTRSDETAGVRELLTIEQMREAKFSEFLVVIFSVHEVCLSEKFVIALPRFLAAPRAKIQACIARGGVPDDDCPTDMASMRFWCTTTKKQTTRDRTQVHTSATASVHASAAFKALDAGFAVGTGPLVPVQDTQALLNAVAVATPKTPATPAPPGTLFAQTVEFAFAWY